MDVHYQTENCRIAGGEKKNHKKSPDTVTSLAQNIQYNTGVYKIMTKEFCLFLFGKKLLEVASVVLYRMPLPLIYTF